MDGGEFFIAEDECFFPFFGEVKACRTAVIGIGFFGEIPFRDQSFYDLYSCRVFDGQFAAEFFFVWVVHDGDLSEDGEFDVFCKAELFDGGFGEYMLDAMQAGNEDGGLSNVSYPRGRGYCYRVLLWVLVGQDPAGEALDVACGFF